MNPERLQDPEQILYRAAKHLADQIFVSLIYGPSAAALIEAQCIIKRAEFNVEMARRGEPILLSH